METLKSLPKADLHLHLDCSLSYKIVHRLNPTVTQGEYNRSYVAPMPCANLAEFLSRAPMGFQLMQSEEALRLVVEDLFEQLHADGVTYAEIRYAPHLHLEKGLTPERVVAAVDRAVEKCVRSTGVEARVILCTLRHFDLQQSMSTAMLVKEFAGSHTVALDIAGDEAGFPLDAHVDAFRFAQEHGLHRTAHAGEACGPKSIWETLEKLKPSRIGHGVRCHEDAKLVDHLKATGIHLEVCPTSNVQIIESIPDWPSHPVDKLYRAGVRLNINTDGRMLTPTTLTREYEGLAEYFGWGEQEFRTTYRMAIEAAFLDEPTKHRLLAKAL